MNRVIVVPTVERNPSRHRGPISSEHWNNFHEQVVHDITNLCNSVNLLYNNLSRSNSIYDNELLYLKQQVRALQNQKLYLEKLSIDNSNIVARYVDIADSKGVSFPNNLDDSHSSMLNIQYGEITLPVTAIENKFYVNSLTSGAVITPVDLVVTVSGTFDKLDGNGLANYEKGGTVVPGDPVQAFNGNNQSYWIRKVVFPIDSPVDEVECELIVTIPESSSSEANTIEIVPFPNGTMDLLELATSTDLTENYVRVSSFSPINNITNRRYHFPSLAVDKIKIRIRQRNWIEEDGKKVFYYGLQELGLKLIDYDRSFTRGASFGSNNSFILRIDAPEGYTFNSIYRIDPDPNFLLEDFSNRHIHVRINTSEDYAIGNIWDSNTMYSPQQLDNPIAANSSSVLYAFVEMNYVSESGGSISPFEVGTTPYIRGIGIAYTLNRG